MKHTTHQINLKVIGYLNFQNHKVYPTKEALKESYKVTANAMAAKEAKRINKAFLLNILLENRLRAAKLAIRVQGWTFKGYCKMCHVINEVIAFNRSLFGGWLNELRIIF